MTEQFIFIGDSLIEFFNWQKRFPNRKIYNYGSAGETAEGLLARLPGIISRVQSPELVMIMTGTNNLAMEDYGFLFTYEKIINLLQKHYPEAAIIMTSLLPIDLSFLGEAVPRINKRLQKIARENGVTFLDLYSLFLDQDLKPVRAYYEFDGVHLSEAGYEVWAKTLENTIFRGLDTA